MQSARFRLPATPASTELVANYFPALGDPTRRCILGLLLAQGLLDDHVDQVAACRHIPEA